MPALKVNQFKINQAAKFLGVSSKTLRRWEDRSVLIPTRTPGNQRVYELNTLVEFRRHLKTIRSQARKAPEFAAQTPKDSILHIEKNPQKLLKEFEILPAQKVVLSSFVIGLVLVGTLAGLNKAGVLRISDLEKNQTTLSNTLLKARENIGPSIIAAALPNFRFAKKVDQNIAYSRDAAVLAAIDIEDAIFGIGIPAKFDKDVEIVGNLTAPNITYKVTAGNGITVVGGQNPIVSLADDAVNGFGTITVGSTEIEANGNDTLTFAGGSNVTISANTTNNTITISSTDTDTNISGWTDEGTNIVLTTPTDTVTIGSSLIIEDGGLIDLSGVLHDDSASQGLKLPQNTSLTDLSGAAGEGYLAYDTDDNLVKVFDGTAWTNISGASTTLQNAYDNDADGSDVIIAESSLDDSLIIRNPAAAGTDTGYVLGIEQLAAGAIDTLNITNSGTGAGINLNNSTLVNIGNAGTDFTSTGGLTIGTGTLTAGGIVNLGDNGDAITLSGTTIGITSNGAGNDISLTSIDDIVFDDAQLISAITLTDTDTAFDSGDTGIVDAINTAYGAATGGGGGLWSFSANVIYPTTATNDFAIGGSTLAASIFSIDESAGTFLFGGDQSANPTLTFEATDSDTANFGFNTNDSFYFSGANVGIEDISPDAKLEVLSTTEQLRLTHTDGTADSRFTVDASGNLTIDNTGTLTTISDNLAISAITSGSVITSVCIDSSNILITCTTGGAGSGDITSVTAGNGLTGGGTAGDVTLDIGSSTTITVGADAISVTADSIGDAQLTFNTGQHLTTASSVTFATVNTGQGDNELFAMDQDVLTTSTPTFGGLTLNGNLDMTSDLILNIGDPNTDFTTGGGLTLAEALVVNDDASFVLAAGEKVLIDAATTDSTGTAGALDINLDTTSSQSGIDVDIETISDAGVDTNSGIKITATATSTDADVIYGLQVANLGGTATAGNEYGIYQAGTAWDFGLYVEDATHLDSTLEVVGDTTLTGDLAVNGDDITSDGNLTIAATGYVRIGDSGTPGSASGDDDLYVLSDLEVDGQAYIDGITTGVSSNAVCVTAGNQLITCSTGGVGSGDITSVVAGSGLTGGGTAGDVTLDIGAGTGITVNANDVAVDQTYAFTWTGIHSWTSSLTNTSSVQDVNLTLVNDADADIISAINVDLTSTATGADGDILYGINLNNVSSADADVTETALRIGSGYDFAIEAEGATNDTVETFITFADPTVSDKTITFPNDTGTVCLTSGNCAGVGGNGDITSVTAGSGLTGGGASGDVTLDIGEGTYIDVAADAISFDPTELETVTWGAQSGSSFVWTFNASSGTDPVLTFSNGVVQLTTGTLDANTNLITNIGDANTDFTSGGGLTLAEALVVNDDATFTLAAGEKILVDAATTDSTGTAGVIDLNLDTTSSQNGIDVDLETISDAGVDTNSGIKVTATATSTDADVIYGIQVANLGGTATAGNEYAIYQAGTAWDYGLYIEDAALLNTTLAVTGDTTLTGDIAINGDDITSDGNLTIAATGYVRIGDSGTPGSASGDDDLYVLSDLEVDGQTYLDGITTGTEVSGVCVDSSNMLVTCATGGSGDITSVVAGSGLTGGGTSGDVTLDIGSSASITVNANDIVVNEDNAFSWTNSHTWTLGATELLTIDAAATDNTGTTGIINLDLDTTSSQTAADLNAEVIDDNGVDTVSALRVTGVMSTDDGDNLYGVHVQNLGGTASSGNEYGIYQAGTAWDYGLYIEDAAAFNLVNAAGGSANSVTLTGTLGAFDGSDTYRGLFLDYTNADHTGASNIFYGIDIDSITGDAQATENAINVGTGWDAVLSYNGTAVINGTGQVVSTGITGTLFSNSSDSNAGTNTIVQGDTLTISGGTNGVDTSLSNDTYTINLDTTEIGTTTFGSGSSIVWTFDAGATDPVLTFASNALTIGTAATITATDTTTFNCTDCLNFDDFSDALTMDAATTITNATASDLSIDLTSTGDFLIKDGGVATASFLDTGAITFAPTSGTNFTVTAAGAGAVNVTTATGAQTYTSSVVTGTTTTSGFVFDATAITSGTGLFATSDSITTGKLVDINTLTADTLTSGTLLNVFSESTGLTSGNLALFDWAPSPSATATGDLVKIHIGPQGDLGTGANLFNILSDTTSLFSVNEVSLTSSLPAAFNATGDVSVAYDLVFTNQTASYIKSSAPLYLEAGESFENNNLTLRTFGTGDVVFDLTGAGGDITIDAASTDNTSTTGVIDLNVDSITTNNVGLNIDYISQSGGTAAGDQFAAKINLDQQDADADLFGLQISLAANGTTLSGTNYVDCFICLTNAENTAAAVLSAIDIGSTAATGGSITNGLFISTTDVTNDLRLQNGEIIDNNVDGTVAITATLLDIEADFQFDIDQANDTTIGVCKDKADANSDVSLQECSATATDIAEYYDSEEEMFPGDVVGIKDVNGKGILTKVQDAYQNNVLGIVSTFPVGQFGKPLGYDLINGYNHPAAIALAGRVPALVTNQNGNIQSGDSLVASDIPGVVMKATKPGKIIGYALEGYDGSVLVSDGTRQQENARSAAVMKFNNEPGDPTQNGVGKILVFIKPGWEDPNNALVFDENGNLVINNETTDYNSQIGSLEERISALELNTASGSGVLSATDSAGLVDTVNLLTTRIDYLQSQIELLQNATPSAEISQVATSSGSFTDLLVLGDTVLSDTVVNGKMTIGSITIDNINSSINALGVLMIQDSNIADIQFQGDKIEMTTDGNLVIKEGVIAGNENFRGTASFSAGVTSVIVDKTGTWTTPPTTIQVTPSFKTTAWVTDITADGFTINVSSSSTTTKDIFWTAIW